MTSTKSYQGINLLALGLGKYGNHDNTNFPSTSEVVAQAEKAGTELEALGFNATLLSVDPKDVQETAMKPIRELIQSGHVPDVVSIGGGLRTLEPMVPLFEKILYFIITECAGAGKVPRFAFPYGPSRMIECVERVLADEKN